VRACTNHQETAAQPEWAAETRSVERQRVLLDALDDPATTLPDLITRFFEPPLFGRRAGFPTVYTAVYRPAEGRVDYMWPGECRRQIIGRFAPGDHTHDYGDLTP
jgi:predicted choloylglycine hydrolase